LVERFKQGAAMIKDDDGVWVTWGSYKILEERLRSQKRPEMRYGVCCDGLVVGKQVCAKCNGKPKPICIEIDWVKHRDLVKALPKTVDGEIVLPNNHYWIREESGVRIILITSISYTECGWWCNDGRGEGYTPEDDLYSTQTIAIKAGTA
jgi:hypothetical protein